VISFLCVAGRLKSAFHLSREAQDRSLTVAALLAALCRDAATQRWQWGQVKSAFYSEF
jgi:hypothetical protein